MAEKATGEAGLREWIGLAVLALPTLLVSIDLTVLNLAVPALSRDLGPSSTELLWIVDVYAFLLAGSLITMGTLGDRVGRRRVLLAGAAVFGVVSTLAAFSTSAEMLILMRALLGVAGASLMPSALALAASMFTDQRRRTVAIGVIIASFSGGTAIGPLLGGVLLEHFWWGSVFLVGVPVVALLLVVGPWLLPEHRARGTGRLDLASAALSLAAVLLVVYGLKRTAIDGPRTLPILAIVVGIVLVVAFVRRQAALRDPLLDLRLFADRTFSVSVAALALGIFALFGATFFIAQTLQLVFGLSPLEAGLWTVPSALGVIAGSMFAPMIVRWVRPSFVISGGLALAASGFGLLAQLDGGSGLTLLVLGSIVISVGLGPMMTLGTDVIVGAVPTVHMGTASAISETAAELGGALGIAILGSIGTVVYRTGLTIPAGVPADLAQASRNTLAGAAGAAEQLPAPLSTGLLDAARDAFVQGFALSAALSSAVVAATAILTAVLMRRV